MESCFGEARRLRWGSERLLHYYIIHCHNLERDISPEASEDSGCI